LFYLIKFFIIIEITSNTVTIITNYFIIELIKQINKTKKEKKKKKKKKNKYFLRNTEYGL